MSQDSTPRGLGQAIPENWYDLGESARISPAEQRAYDSIVKPNAIVPVPRYFLKRWLPLLGTSRAWLAIAFRQVAFVSRADAGEVTIRTTLRRLGSWCGLSHVRVHQLLRQPDHLPWFVRTRLGSRSDRRTPRAEPTAYLVRADIPLVPEDQAKLTQWLTRQPPAEDISWIDRLDQALEAQDLKLDPKETPLPAEPATIQQIVQKLRGEDSPLPPSLDAACTELHARWVQPDRVTLVTHYFLRQWLPDLSPGLGWLITLLRSRAYAQADGSIVGQVWTEGGWSGLARAMGVSRKSLVRWAQSPHARLFFERRQEARDPGDRRNLLLTVRLSEPIHEQDQGTYKLRLAAQDLTRHRDAPAQNLPEPRQDLPDAGHRLTSGGQDSPATGKKVTRAGTELNALSPSRGTQETLSKESEDSQLQAAGSRKKSVGDQESAWDLNRLLIIHQISSDVRKRLQSSGVPGWAFVSRLLYACSPEGAGIRSPGMFAASRLIEEPGLGAGGDFDRIARLGPLELFRLLAEGHTYGQIRDPRWQGVMGGELKRARRVARALGLGPLETELSGEPAAGHAGTTRSRPEKEGAPTSAQVRAWRLARLRIRAKIPRADFDTWVRDVEVASVEGDAYVLAAGNQYACDWLEEHLRPEVEAALENALSKQVRVTFVVQEALG